MSVCRVIHVDDHELFRAGLEQLLAPRPNLELVASLSGENVLEKLRSVPCDVLLLDLSLPGVDGLKLLGTVTEVFPEVKVIALTMHKDREYFRTAIARGVRGYVLKDDVFETLADAIRLVHEGQRYYSRAIRDLMVEEYEMRQSEADSVQLLTPREQEVLKMIARGMMNKDIADKLFLSVRTVESHRAKIMRKLKINNVQGLVRFAVKSAMI